MRDFKGIMRRYLIPALAAIATATYYWLAEHYPMVGAVGEAIGINEAVINGLVVGAAAYVLTLMDPNANRESPWFVDDPNKTDGPDE